jgi:hypothetical protein
VEPKEIADERNKYQPPSGRFRVLALLVGEQIVATVFSAVRFLALEEKEV